MIRSSSTIRILGTRPHRPLSPTASPEQGEDGFGEGKSSPDSNPCAAMTA